MTDYDEHCAAVEDARTAQLPVCSICRNRTVDVENCALCDRETCGGPDCTRQVKNLGKVCLMCDRARPHAT